MTELLDFYIERIEREVAVEAHREEAKSRGFWERLTLFGRGGFFRVVGGILSSGRELKATKSKAP